MDDDLSLRHVKDFMYMYVNCVHSLVYVDDNYQISYGFIVLLEMTDNLSRAMFPPPFFAPLPLIGFEKYPKILISLVT